jgi:hypothetical protein
VYSTLQPELVKEQAQREEIDPAFTSQHPKEHLKHEQQAAEAQRDTAISRAMAQDFKEAGQQITQGGGFAWGIRKAIFGGKEDAVAADAPGVPESEDQIRARGGYTVRDEQNRLIQTENENKRRVATARQKDHPNDEEKK